MSKRNGFLDGLLSIVASLVVTSVVLAITKPPGANQPEADPPKAPPPAEPTAAKTVLAFRENLIDPGELCADDVLKAFTADGPDPHFLGRLTDGQEITCGHPACGKDFAPSYANTRIHTFTEDVQYTFLRFRCPSCGLYTLWLDDDLDLYLKDEYVVIVEGAHAPAHIKGMFPLEQGGKHSPRTVSDTTPSQWEVHAKAVHQQPQKYFGKLAG